MSVVSGVLGGREKWSVIGCMPKAFCLFFAQGITEPRCETDCVGWEICACKSIYLFCDPTQRCLQRMFSPRAWSVELLPCAFAVVNVTTR